jgi:hypothetical protein
LKTLWFLYGLPALILPFPLQNVYKGFIRFSQLTAIISVNSINRWSLIFCEAGAVCFTIIYMTFRLETGLRSYRQTSSSEQDSFSLTS